MTATATSPSPRIPFGARVLALLEERGKNQAWLASRMGVDRSTVSRVIALEDRVPELRTLQDMAAVFETTVEELVRGTLIEDRVQDAELASNVVRRSAYDEAVGKMLDYESRNIELQSRLRDAATTHEEQRQALTREVQAAHHRIAGLTHDLDAARAAHRQVQEDNVRHRQEAVRFRAALRKAVVDLSAHKKKIEELVQLVEKLNAQAKTGNRISQIGTALAGIAAFTGVVTLATFLGSDEEKEDEDDEDN